MGEKVTSLDRSMETAAEVGVGAAHGGLKSVKWGVLGKIAWAWVLTIPLAALVSALIYALFLLL